MSHVFESNSRYLQRKYFFLIQIFFCASVHSSTCLKTRLWHSRTKSVTRIPEKLSTTPPRPGSQIIMYLHVMDAQFSYSTENSMDLLNLQKLLNLLKSWYFTKFSTSYSIIGIIKTRFWLTKLFTKVFLNISVNWIPSNWVSFFILGFSDFCAKPTIRVGPRSLRNWICLL